MLNTETRHEAQLNRLLRKRKRAGNNCLTGNDCRHDGEENDRRTDDFRHHQEERVANGDLRIFGCHGQYHCPLPHIIEHQRGQHEEQPAKLDGPASEMPHIGVKRLCARYGQNNGSHRHKCAETVNVEKIERIQRV